MTIKALSVCQDLNALDGPYELSEMTVQNSSRSGSGIVQLFDSFSLQCRQRRIVCCL